MTRWLIRLADARPVIRLVFFAGALAASWYFVPRAAPTEVPAQQVLKGEGGRSVCLIPVRGTHVQRHGDVGLSAIELAEQELSEQCVVAVPTSPTIQLDQERVGALELAEAIFLIRKAKPRRALLTHFYPEWDGVDFEKEVSKFEPRCEVIEARAPGCAARSGMVLVELGRRDVGQRLPEQAGRRSPAGAEDEGDVVPLRAGL